MTSIFRPARQNRIFQDVVEQVQEAIIDGQLKVGDRLPPERELKEMLRTSRGTLREALRVLEQKGLIEIKLGMGGGAVVKAVTTDLVAESLDLLIRSQQVSLRHLTEFRERVESDVATLATKRITGPDKAELGKLLKEARKYTALGVAFVSDFLSVDKKIHLCFAKISGNPIYYSILKTIHENNQRYYDRYLAMGEPEMKENLRDLENVITAMNNGEAERAGLLVQTHVKRFDRYMEMHRQERGDD